MQLETMPSTITAFPPHYAKTEIKCLSPSTFARNHLYHLFLAQSIEVQFPFYLECAPFKHYLLLHTVSGEGKIVYNMCSYDLKPNSIIFIDCQAGFRLDLVSANHWFFNLIVIDGSSTCAYFETYHQNHYFICNLKPLSHIPQIIDKLLQITDSDSMENVFITSKLITDLLTDLILAKDADIHHTTNLPKYLIQIKSLFDSNYKEHFNLDDLAQTYNISKYKIIRDFSTYLHTSPINYLINKRISVAKRLLLETDYPVYEIASMVGIDNINHFTNLFKKSTNLTPNNYRKTVQPTHTEYLED